MTTEILYPSVESSTLRNSDLQVEQANQLSIGNVVAIDDDTMTLRALKGHAKRHGYRLQSADNATSGLQLINESTAIALVDLRMPDINGFACLKYIRENYPHVQVIILTGSSETNDAVEAMRAGAFQFVTKPFDPKQLLVYLSKASQASATEGENRDLRESRCHNLPVQVPVVTGDVSGLIMRQVARLAAVDSTVFIGGESGTGKSTVARMIHQQSNRAGGPFVSINCASLPRDLLTSELFGHTKGSFTGAVKDRAGHAEVADGGTLFLDEIGDLPLELQPKLLTFLQDRTIQRLGSSEVRKVDVRLIVATHRDLAEMCREHAFRQDLYFRLMVLSVDLPPLRDRKAELPSMAAGILTKVCERMGTEPKLLTEGAIRLLSDHTWPGNIRELENVLERAVAFSAEPQIHARDLIVSSVALERRSQPRVSLVTSTHVADERRVPLPTSHSPAVNPQDVLGMPIAASDKPMVGFASQHVSGIDARTQPASSSYVLVGKSLDEIERDAILHTLDACKGNKAKTARMLGVSEKSIYNKMRRLCIERDASVVTS